MYMFMHLVHLLHDIQDLLCIFTTVVKLEVFTALLLKIQFWDVFCVGCMLLCGLPGPEDDVTTILRTVRINTESIYVSLSVPEDRGHGLPGCDDLYQHFGGICSLCLQETSVTSRKTIVIICTVMRI
jgi:hypothetical protein